MKHNPWLLLCLGLALSLAFVLPVQASAVPAEILLLEPRTLEISGLKDKSTPEVSFYLTPQVSGLDTLTFSVDKLTQVNHPAGQTPLSPPGQFAFSPAEITAPAQGIRQVVSLSIGSFSDPGVWSGELTVQYTGAYTGTQFIPLTITLQTTPVLQVESPARIVVRGANGDASISRSITLLETGKGSPAADLSFFPLPLTNADQSKEFPKQNLSVSISGTHTLAGGARGDVYLTFDFKGVPSGAYSGDVIVQSANAAEVKIPVEISVKDPPLGAGIALAFGVLVGVGLTIYRKSVMPKDQVRVRMQVVRNHYAEDRQFEEYCAKQRVEPLLVQTEEHLRKDDLEKARETLAAAEDLWNNWYDANNHATLIMSIEEIKKLVDKIDQAEAGLKTLPPVAALHSALSQTLAYDIPEYVTKANDLRTKIVDKETGWQEVLFRCEGIYNDLADLHNKLADAASSLVLEVDEKPGFITRLGEIENLVKALNRVPAVSDLQPIESGLDTLFTELNTAHQKSLSDREGYDSYVLAANALIEPIPSDPLLAPVIEFIQRSGLGIAAELKNQGRWSRALERAQVSWWAAQAYRLLNKALSLTPTNEASGQPAEDQATWGEVQQAIHDWANWLRNSSKYALQPKSFYDEMLPLADALQKKLDAAGQSFSIDFDAAPTGKVLGFDEGALAADLFDRRTESERDLANIPAPGEFEPAKVPFWQAPFSTPRNRLLTMHIVTFFLGVGFLVLVGYKELYADIHTFGEGGWWDYVKLILWGFGAEAGRAEVVSLVTEWGVLPPRTG